ncbi:MAG: rhomboid family intramembrane serine protease [Nanoarchaeota archaeon]|nr:rhomboid family intramembrane serine protease [Nanoarchaeota archaeon]
MVYVYKTHSNPRKNHLAFSATTNIILLNIISFIAFTILIYRNAGFLDYIALKPSNILAGKYLWTFVTSMFMHAGFFHIFVNMVSLIFIGNLVEKLVGRKRYFFLYLISGLFAGLFYVLSGLFFSPELNTYAVGASGALFGLIGFLMIITPNLPVYVMFIPIPVKMKYAAPGILVVLWLISIAGSVPIGNTAHLGGLIIGVVYGIYIKGKYKNKTQAIRKYFS